MTPLKQAKKELKENGYYLKRSDGKHDVYYNDETHITIPLKRHDFDEDDLRYIRKEIKGGIK